MKEQILFNEFITEYCQNDLQYAQETLYEWLESIESQKLEQEDK